MSVVEREGETDSWWQGTVQGYQGNMVAKAKVAAATDMLVQRYKS